MKNIFFKSFKLNLRRNRLIFITFSILFFIITIICVAMCHGMSGWSFVATHSVYAWENKNGDGNYIKFSDPSVSLTTSLRYVLFGTLSIILIIIYSCIASKKIISSEIDSGAITFWLTKKISKNEIIFGKILSIYFAVFIFWIISFVPVGLTLLTVQDKWNSANILFYMFQYLFMSLLVSSLIIILNLLLRNNDEWFIITCSIIAIYFIIMSFMGKSDSNSWIKYLNINNIFPNYLNILDKPKETKWWDLFDGIYQSKMELFALEKVKFVKSIPGIVGLIISISGISYLTSIIFKKIEFSI